MVTGGRGKRREQKALSPVIGERAFFTAGTAF